MEDRITDEVVDNPWENEKVKIDPYDIEYDELLIKTNLMKEHIRDIGYKVKEIKGRTK